MNRREVIGGFATFLPAWCSGAHAQVTGKPTLIALLASGSEADAKRLLDGFRRGLQELGYVEGRHHVIEARFAEGAASRLPAYAEELVGLKPAVIVATSTPAAMAARKATSEIAIVSPVLGDAVGVGLIESWARPAGNVTGILVTDPDLAAKQLALVREAVPGAAKIGVLVNPQNAATAELQREGAKLAAATLSFELASAAAETADDLEGAFAALARADVGAVFVFADILFFAERRRIAAAAQSARLPTMYIFREHVEAGGLMSYGVDIEASFRRAASYVDRILKGAKPGDLPVELPTKLELVINLKTAKALGLTFPPSLLARADEVIE